MAKRTLTAQNYEQKRLRKMAGLSVGKQVLDIGYAHVPNQYLLEQAEHITGIDLAAPPGNCRYHEMIQGDVFELEKTRANQFDTVMAGEFIEHIESPHALLRLFYNLLKENGTLVLSTPNPLDFPVIFWEWAISNGRFYTENHVHSFPPRWVNRMLHRCGFEDIKCHSVGLWPLNIPCPVSMSYQVIYIAKKFVSGATRSVSTAKS